MLFNSLTFIVFYTVVLSLYGLLRHWTWRKRLLLGASYVFYGAWNPPYIAILIFSTVLDFYLAQCISLSTLESTRKRLLILSIASNLLLLGSFKYANFLAESLENLLGLVGLGTAVPELNVILPIGISFYTFASLSYTIDVYRREIPATRSLLNYALFVSFFPHLVAGPIVRASVLLPQMEKPRHIEANLISWGLTLLIIGLFSKVVMADAVFAPIADQIYANPSRFLGLDSWLGVFAFSGQIFFDFSGYSLCAIGIALSFGFHFPDNFNKPYAAISFSEFWRRWHISLSSWLRDYLYIPLGGNRNGAFATARNLMLTMLLGGIWHGASWMFVVWGGLHGVYLIVERAIKGSFKQTSPVLPLSSITFRSAGVFLLVSLTWIPFRAADWLGVKSMLTGLLQWDGDSKLGLASVAVGLTAVVATFTWQVAMRDTRFEEWFASMSTTARTALLAGCLTAIFLVSGGDQHAFIYFQF